MHKRCKFDEDYEDSDSDSDEYSDKNEEINKNKTSTSSSDSDESQNDTEQNYYEDDVDADKEGSKDENIFKELKYLIKNSKGAAIESVCGESNELPIYPSLYVKRFGHVPLPINELVGESLIKLAVQSPFGLKHETILDTKIRNSFEIEPDSVEIRHEDWDTGLQKLVDRIGKALGCNCKIEAKLYKLLIYRKGGHFKKHRDTEKDKNMFATLVLQLPSIHEGGELVIYHENSNTKDIHDFGTASGRSESTINFVAHYADVEHEVLEVKSGYRLALVYSLCWIDGNGNSCVKGSENVAKLAKCLEKLNESSYQIAITLNHKYTPSAFSQNGIKALKGIDNNRYSHLFNANARLPPEKQLNFYIAHAELVFEAQDISQDKYIRDASFDGSNYRDRGDWEVHDSGEDLKEWYNIDGNPSFENKRIGFDFFTGIIDPNSRDVFIDMSDECSYSYKHTHIDGYMGNAGATKTTTYHRYLLVFWPKSNEFNTYLKINVNDAIDSLYRSFSINISSPLNVNNLKILVDYLKTIKTGINKSLTSKVMKIFQLAKNLELFKEFTSNVKIDYNNSQLSDMIVLFGWNAVKDEVSKLLLPISKKTLLKTLELVAELYKNDKETAYECLLNSIQIILDNPHEFTKKRYDDICDHYSIVYRDCANNDKNDETSVYHKLAETMCVFNYKNMDHMREQFTKLLALDKDNSIKILLDLLKTFSERNNLKDFINFNLIFTVIKSNSININNLMQTLDVVKVLYSINKVDSFELFNQFVLPQMEKSDFSYNSSHSFGFTSDEYKIKFFYKLAETILIFDIKIIDNIKMKYANLIINEKGNAMKILAKLLTKFYGNTDIDNLIDFNVLFKSLQKYFNSSTIEKLLENCEIVQDLCNINKIEIGFEYLNHAVLPSLDKSEIFVVLDLTYRSSVESSSEYKSNVYYKLANTILLFENINVNELSIKYTNLLVNEKQDPISIFIMLFDKFKNSKKLIDFIKYDMFLKPLHQKMYSNTIEKLMKNCNLIKVLIAINQLEASYEYFMETVFPVLDKQEMFIEYKHLNNNLSCNNGSERNDAISIYYELASTIVLFNNKENFNDICEKYDVLIKTSFIDRVPDLLALLNLLSKKEEVFCRTPILKLFEFRLKWLTSKISDAKKFTWFMPGSVPSHSELDEFLRSERSEITFSGFYSIYDARRFSEFYGGFKNGYSLQMSANGTGRNSKVHIQKTRHYFEKQLEQANILILESKRIETLLKKYSKST